MGTDDDQYDEQYDEQYKVAKIENKTYDDISKILGLFIRNSIISMIGVDNIVQYSRIELLEIDLTKIKLNHKIKYTYIHDVFWLSHRDLIYTMLIHLSTGFNIFPNEIYIFEKVINTISNLLILHNRNVRKCIEIIHIYMYYFIDIAIALALVSNCVYYTELIVTNIKRWDSICPDYIGDIDKKNDAYKMIRLFKRIVNKINNRMMINIIYELIAHLHNSEYESESAKRLFIMGAKMNSSLILDIFRHYVEIKSYIERDGLKFNNYLETISSKKLIKIIDCEKYDGLIKGI